MALASDLSPAAQAIWEAFNEDEAGVFVDYGDKLATALRAAADQVVPEPDDWDKDNFSIQALRLRSLVRDRFFIIAAELENHK
jgi:proline racemase